MELNCKPPGMWSNCCTNCSITTTLWKLFAITEGAVGCSKTLRHRLMILVFGKLTQGNMCHQKWFIASVPEILKNAKTYVVVASSCEAVEKIVEETQLSLQEISRQYQEQRQFIEQQLERRRLKKLHKGSWHFHFVI